MSQPFCACCIKPIVGEPRRRPEGKGGAMVNLCADCDWEDESTSAKQRRRRARKAIELALAQRGRIK